MSSKVESQLKFVFERLGYHPARRAMNCQFGRSFPKGTKEMFADIELLATSDKKHADFIDSCGENCVHLGTRHLELFDVKDPIRKKALNTFFSGLQPTKNKLLSSSYPFPITNQTVLASIKKNEIHVMDSGAITVDSSDYKFVVFSTVIENEVEEDGTKYLNKNGQDLVKNNRAHFYYVTSEYRQLFHVLYWDEQKDTAILSIDKNLLSVHKSRDQLFLTRTYVENSTTGALGHPLNVFDAIEPLYKEVDGRIVRLGHVTSDGNPVRLKLTRGQICLKQDKYHGAGETGGHVHAKFSVGKSWSFGTADQRSVIEVDLAGKAAMLDTAQPLSDFEVAKCSRMKDLNFAIQKVRTYAS